MDFNGIELFKFSIEKVWKTGFPHFKKNHLPHFVNTFSILN